MNLTTNIVLKGNHGRTQPYVIQLIRGDKEESYRYVRQDDESWPGEHAILFKNSLSRVLNRKKNEWYVEDNLVGGVYTVKTSKLRIYFPQYSADTYDKNCTYMLGASIFIKGTEIELGCFKIQRKDALACPPTKFDGMDEYLEYLDFDIPDPSSLYFNLDEESPLNFLNPNIADDAARLYVSLYIVEPSDDKYIMKDGWTGAQNNIPINMGENLGLNIAYNKWTNEIIMRLKYNHNIGGLIADYIKNVYYLNIQDSGIIWDFVVMDDEDIFYHFPGKTTIYSIATMGESFDESFNKSFYPPSDDYGVMAADFCFDYNEDFNIGPESVFIKVGSLKNYEESNGLFSSLSNWKPGMFLRGSASIFDNESEDKSTIINIMSNKLPLTQELFAKMVNHQNFPSQINLDDLNMNNININAVNKIENVTQNVTYKVDPQKSHMIQPIFYQTREIEQIIIHPAVTENISLNLETYKPYVKRFLLQIEGVSFKEIGRTSQGIVFKIYGNMLPKSVESGIAYVLDQDMNLVTTGKYKYVY